MKTHKTWFKIKFNPILRKLFNIEICTITQEGQVVGYLKTGKGKKYVEKFSNNEYQLSPQYIIYSQPNGTETKIKINSED